MDLQFGLMLFLIAAGLTLVFGILDILNVAHGSLYMAGAYVAAQTMQVTQSFVAVVVVAAVVTGLVGLVLELVLIRKLVIRDHLAQVLGTFAVILIANDVIKMIWGPAPMMMSMPPALSGPVHTHPRYVVSSVSAVDHCRGSCGRAGPLFVCDAHESRRARARRGVQPTDGHLDGRARTAVVFGRLCAGCDVGRACGRFAWSGDGDSDRHGRANSDFGAGVYRDRRDWIHSWRVCGCFAGGFCGYGRARLFTFIVKDFFSPAVASSVGPTLAAHFNLYPDGGGVGIPTCRVVSGARMMMRKLFTATNMSMLGLVLLLVFPLVAPALNLDFYVSFVRRVLIFALAATSLNFILGYGGMVALGHAAFFGAGAYVVAMLSVQGVSQALIAWPVAMLVAGALALVIGLISLANAWCVFHHDHVGICPNGVLSVYLPASVWGRRWP
jgi:branched-chain amino acid transport system permease protein